MRKNLLFLAVLLAFPAGALAQPKSRPPEIIAPASTPVPTAAPAAELSATDAIILGVVEGVTEFLPISSTGHLIIVTRLLRLESEQPLHGSDGRPLWFRPPSAKRPAGEPLTLKLAADTFNVVIQFGAIAAVALLYWTQLVSMLMGVLGRDPAGLKLFGNIVVAFLPVAVLGLVAKDWIDAHLFSVGPVIVSQVAGAGLMLFAERWRRQHIVLKPDDAGLNDLAPHQAAGIGALQCAALWPGTSRSMMVMVGGYFAGLSPRRAAEFSFLLGFVTLSGATVVKSYRSGAAMIEVFGWSHVLLGCAVAAVTAAVCVHFLVGWLTRHGLAAFAYYRLAMAALLAGWFYL